MRPLSDEGLRAIVEVARIALADEKWVRWALGDAADANEAALVDAYRALVALADRER